MLVLLQRLIHLTTAKLKPHQLVQPDVIANKCSTLNPALENNLTKVTTDGAAEKVPLTTEDTAVPQTKLPSAPPTEQTRMLSPEDIRSPCDDDNNYHIANGVTSNNETNQNNTSNEDTSSDKKGPAFVW